MRPKGSAEALEMRRRIAANLLKQGKGVREVARLVQASPSAVSRWKQTLERGGEDALKAKPHPGKRPRLDAAQREQLAQALQQGARAWGYPTDLWTLARIAAVIARLFGVGYHPSHVWRILRAMGWSAQKPQRRARERDEAAIAHWRAHEWAEVKKKPKRRGRG